VTLADGRDYYAAVAENIERHGRHLQAVFPVAEGDPPPFVYTIGNRPLPELLLVGAWDLAWLLNDLSARQREAGEALLGDVSLGGEHPVRLIDVTDDAVKEKWTVQAGRHYGDEAYLVTQVVVPDKAGRFPGEDGCQEPYAAQPLLR
jgi:hypothetical protein